MVKKMETVEVFTNTKGNVVIEQDRYGDRGEAHFVVLTTEQARSVCEWILEASEEIETARASGYRFEDEAYDPNPEENEQPELPGLDG